MSTVKTLLDKPDASAVVYPKSPSVPHTDVASAIEAIDTRLAVVEADYSNDVEGPAASVDGEGVLFDGITGKLLKRSSVTGILKATAGVQAAAVAGTDYAAATSGSAILKGNGAGGFSAAAAGTDYAIPAANTDITSLSVLASINTGPLAGMRNRIINGCMRVNQRAAASNADDTYAFDRWNILTQTGTVAASAVGLIEDAWPYAMRITQSQASAQRFGVSQIIEAANCYDLRGKAVTLSARVRMSASTTLRYAVLEWTGTADVVTSDVVSVSGGDQWGNATFTAGQFFLGADLTVTATGSTALTANTAATVSLSTTLGSSTANVIVFFWTDSTQAQNVTLDLGKVQFEVGAVATAFEGRAVGLEYALCTRYYMQDDTLGGSGVTNADGTQINRFTARIGTPMRTTPTMAFTSMGLYDGSTTATMGTVSANYNTTTVLQFDAPITGGPMAFNNVVVMYDSGSSNVTLSAEL